MIKKFNENWESLSSKSDTYDLKVLQDETWSDTYKRAKNLSTRLQARP